MRTLPKADLVHFSNVEVQAVRFGADLVQNSSIGVHVDTLAPFRHIVSC